MIDIPEILQSYGLPGLAILGLLYDRTRIVKRNDELTDRTFSREKETAVLLNSMMEILRRIDGGRV